MFTTSADAYRPVYFISRFACFNGGQGYESPSGHRMGSYIQTKYLDGVSANKLINWTIFLKILKREWKKYTLNLIFPTEMVL